ncbi:MAG: TraR/DksA C4-type zinc finger protein [Minisyncoccia bacterium]|jgi:RNA polymerase-binding transcription factor DksA
MLNLDTQRHALGAILGRSPDVQRLIQKLGEPIEGQDEGEIASEFHEKHIVTVRLEYDCFLRWSALAAESKLRMGSEEYTTCSRCGGTISDERLTANPWACLCTLCQEQQECEGSGAPVARTIEEFV